MRIRLEERNKRKRERKKEEEVKEVFECMKISGIDSPVCNKTQCLFSSSSILRFHHSSSFSSTLCFLHCIFFSLFSFLLACFPFSFPPLPNRISSRFVFFPSFHIHINLHHILISLFRSSFFSLLTFLPFSLSLQPFITLLPSNFVSRRVTRGERRMRVERK